MNEAIYKVKICIGAQMYFEFRAIGDVKSSGFTFTEIDKDNMIMPERGMIVMDGCMHRMVFNYLAFNMVMDVIETKEAGNGHLFECVTDILHVKVEFTYDSPLL